METPHVSIIIPCYNEEKYIGACIDSIINNDYPKNRLEILVVDGMSNDASRYIIKRFQETYTYIKMLDNPKRITPSALNIGIKAARGDFIIRMDAHAIYEGDYISKCVKYLLEYDADNVGGILETIPRVENLVGKSIAKTFSHTFGSGNALYKTGIANQPVWVDTVPFGCYRRNVFEKIGYFDERLTRSQDIEFNKRLRRLGGKILLVPQIKSKYYIRSDYRSFFVHNFKDGFWAVYPYKYVKEAVEFRHLVPILSTCGLITTLFFGLFKKIFLNLGFLMLGIYIYLNIYYSIKIATDDNNIKLVPLCFIAFVNRHLGYSLGSLYALFHLLLSRDYILILTVRSKRSRKLSC